MGEIQKTAKKDSEATLRMLEGGKEGVHVIPPYDQTYYGKPVVIHVKEFGILFGAISFGFLAYFLYKDIVGFRIPLLSTLGIILPLLGWFAPKTLYFPWKYWMIFAHKLGGVMTYLILGLAWWLMIVPMSLLLRIIGKETFNKRSRTGQGTYWEDRPADPEFFKKLERQF
jgi:hypothetical protein